MNPSAFTPLTNQQLASELQVSLAPLGVVPIEQELPDETSIGGLRRRRRSRGEDSVGVLTLLDIDGVLVWEEGAVTSSTSVARRRRGGTAADGEVVTQLKFSKELGVNEIANKLAALDLQLTAPAASRLLEWDRTAWTSSLVTSPIRAQRALLLIHGTFSSSQRIVEQLKSESCGRNFLEAARNRYDHVLSFDHYTLSRSPMVNAVDLERALTGHKIDELDVICHSRGGLVTRWWLEVLNHRQIPIRTVFVGCPLRGTSLADPASLRHGLNLLTNAGRLMGSTAQLIPMLTAAAGLMQIVTSVAGFTAQTPLLDAAIAMIPGLAAQSRTRTNYELDALNHGDAQAVQGYSAVVSEFHPQEIGWKFWRLFNFDRLANAAGDYLVFNQANDLVVDTESMTHHVFGGTPDSAKIFRIEKSPTVSHTTYFKDPATLQFIRSQLA